MKVAISAMGGSLEAMVSEQFGRCAYFLIVDSETMKFEPLSNPGSSMAGGAGPEAARTIADHGTTLVLTGRVGRNAEIALKAAGIRIVTGIPGSTTVRKAIEDYL